MVGKPGKGPAYPLSEGDLIETITALKRFGSQKEAAKYLGISDRQVRRRMDAAAARVIEPAKEHPFAIEHEPERGGFWEIRSGKDNKYRFGAFGDLHAASKHCRWDVRSDLMKRSEDFGAFAILDTGNWCEGQATFNRYDLEAVGMDDQLALLAERYPKVSIPTYAVTAADHEGWWVKREGVDVGKACEYAMRQAGHNWTNLGYVEADILLTNINSKKSCILRVCHPGGGSAYATSYKPQKIIESYEGAEKPAVLLLGHYHKLEGGNVRNVWYQQTGCQCDQTTFLRTKSIENHVGGVLLEMEQDPETGAIISFKPDMLRYFNRGYYFREGRGNRRWSASGPIRQVPRGANTVS